jgi:hypothetical protein
LQQEGRRLLVFLKKIRERDDAPDATDEQLLKLPDDVAGDFDPLPARADDVID